MKKIRFMDTSFRDGFQSVFGARVRTKDFLPAVEASVEAGIDHFEFGGGARFQSLFFYCQESAFDMMDQIRLTTGPDVNLQTLARGINVVGLSQQPRDIINMHARLFHKYGTTTIRNFDALNDMRNLDYSGRCIADAGLKHQITITLMGLPPGIEALDVHSAAFYMEKLDDIEKLGIPYDSIVFKDASGTCPPQTVFETIEAARDRVGKDTTLWYHTHDTAGMGTICIMAAIRAGVDGIDLAQAPVSSGTGQPDILTVWHSLRHTGFTLDIDYKKIVRAERVFDECMSKYMIPPEAKRTTPTIVLSPMPGGALTANTMMMRDTNTLHLFPRVIEEMAEVVAKGGYGTSVTPVSQFYFQQAFMNVVQGKWKKIAAGYGNMALGYFGRTPRKPDPEVVALAGKQLNKPVFTGNPLDILEPGIPPAQKMLEENDLPVTDENTFIVATCKNKGLDFLQGNAPLAIYLREEIEKRAAPAEVGESETIVLTISGRGIAIERSKADEAKPVEKEKKAPAPPRRESHGYGKDVVSNTPGRVKRVLLQQGAQVQPDDIVMVIEFMGMENEISSYYNGNISRLCVEKGDFVKEGSVLFAVK
ncbi:MAG: biotin attachment protein [Candidatus Cloacimonetes bacterium]|nr:biotin attachment protein [Candidatus Cloacimonadota bacterium]